MTVWIIAGFIVWAAIALGWYFTNRYGHKLTRPWIDPYRLDLRFRERRSSPPETS